MIIRLLKRLFCDHGGISMISQNLELTEPDRVVGASLSWSGEAVVAFEAKGRCRLCGANLTTQLVLPTAADRIIHREYYKHRRDFPCDPITGKELEIAP